MNIRKAIEKITEYNPDILLPDVDIIPERIHAIMINEVVPSDPERDFYGSDHHKSTSTLIRLFHNAGIPVSCIQDILDCGIYITNACRIAKSGYTVDPENLSASLPYPEAELSLFENLRVIVLCGDVAKKAFNTIIKRKTGKNVIPSGSTHKLRKNTYYLNDIRVIPSYIITGKNILIEKQKQAMVVEDIREMYRIING